MRLRALIEGDEEEAKAILMRALPIEYRKKILQEEDKRTQDRLVLTGVGMLDSEEITTLILSETGVNPKFVSKRGDKVIIGLPGQNAKEKVFQMLDREHLVGGGMISVRQEATALLATEIDDLMRRWLTVDDRARLRDGTPSSQSGHTTQKWQREVIATPEEKNAAAIQEIKVAKTTQTNFSGEPKGATENLETQNAKGKGKGKGGRGKGGGEPSPNPVVTPPAPTPTITQTIPFYNPNPMQPVMGFQQYPPTAVNQWYPPSGYGYPINPSPMTPPHPHTGWSGNQKGGKGEKGGKGGEKGKGKGGQ